MLESIVELMITIGIYKYIFTSKIVNEQEAIDIKTTSTVITVLNKDN